MPHRHVLPRFIDPDLGGVWLQFAVPGAVLIALEFLVDGAVGRRAPTGAVAGRPAPCQGGGTIMLRVPPAATRSPARTPA